LLLIVALVVVVAQLHGCGRGASHTRFEGALTSSPLLIHVCGWNGPVTGDERFAGSLRRGGLPHEIELFDWTDGSRGLFALRRAQTSAAPSDKLAARIVEAIDASPGRPIVLTGDSSGCGVLLDALEKLPADKQVQTVVLASPAMSSGYDLAPALSHVRGHVYSFNSSRDWFILQLGTTVFGTTDCRHEAAAGNAGFRWPADAATQAKLVQMPYDPAWQDRFGQPGGHSDALRPRFTEGFLAPLILRDEP
jgi:hypothetical protein